MRAFPLLSSVLVLLLTTPAFAQRELKDIPDPDPEIERKSFQVAEGFDVNLFAADPQLAKPIQMNFDGQGRLWVASSEVYPQVAPGQEPNDRVLILEDSDGDGKSDKTTVFVNGLLIPTGVVPGDGGAYVANSTELVHFRDTDNDGKADSRRVMLSGFGTEDTHHILHTFRWGMDGMLYFNQSIYIHSHIETPHGVRRLGGGGIWRFRTETMELDILSKGLVNPWGHQFDAWGQSLATDGAGGEGINFAFPGSVFLTSPGATRIVKGMNPGSPKYCGMEIVDGGHLPEDWRGNIITNDFRGHRVCRFVITEDGSSYAAREMGEVIKTTHVAFRPIDVAMGPDGAIYIADWYNPIIQHGEVDFRDPRRDHTHGRIWRITAKGRPLVERPKLAGSPVNKLLDSLKASESFTRLHAKRQMKEMGAEAVLPALANWVEHLDPADAQFEHHALEALWTYQSLNTTEPQLLARLLKARDHRARAAAVRVLSQWSGRIPFVFEALTAAVGDDHPRVRLEAVRALAAIPELRSAELAMRALDRPVDVSLDFALWQTARDLQAVWLPAVNAGTFDFGGNASHLTFALQSVGSASVVGPLVQLLKAGKLPPGRDEAAVTLVASLGGPPELRLAYDLALAPETPVAQKSAILNALTTAATRRMVRPEGALLGIAPLLTSSDAQLQAAALRAAGIWKLEDLRKSIEALALGGDTRVGVRQAAVDALVFLGGETSRNALLKLSAKDRPQPQRLAAAVAIAELDLKAGAKLAVEVLADHKAGDDVTALFQQFIQRKEGPAAFVTALENQKLPEDAAKLGVRAARTSGRETPELIAALSTAGGLTSGAKVLTAEQMQALVTAVKEQGDPVRGEALFRRADQVCMKCHAISGAGGLVGPDLASIGASAQVDYLIDSLLQPNKAVKENYNSVIVSTNNGKVINGIKVRQSDTELILRDTDDKEVVIPLADIDEQVNGGSLMPVGLTDTLTQPELIDMVRFLSELGKVGRYAPSQVRVSRRWQVLAPSEGPVKDTIKFQPDAVVLNNQLPWQPAYTRVSGHLPVAELISGRLASHENPITYARTYFEVTTAGKISLKVTGTDIVKLWVDDREIKPTELITADFAPGRHKLTVAVTRDDSPGELRCELVDVAGSPAQVQFVSGK